jgi:uncharacterized phage protein (TIGR02218 family)
MRNIPIALAAHLESGRTSLCFLVKIRCKDGTLLAFTTLDAALTYTDGPDGPIEYLPDNGVTPSEQVWSASLSVDTAEAVGVVTPDGITEQRIRSGVFDHARFWIYRVNYLDLSQGHYIWASGTTGETKFTENRFSVELRSKSQQLKQPISESYTLTCPVAYGSAACGKTLEWFDAAVATVDTEEPDRIFTVTGDSEWPGGDQFKFGVAKVITGDNAGAEVEVELHDDDSIELLLPLPYALAEDDELQFRIDCNKEARDTDFGCKSELRWGAEWPLHHRGFPDIPIADQGSLLAPGAQTPSVPGSGTVSMEAE